jgi:hypothetical protein
MSDTPTFANLLTQRTGGPAARAEVYAHLRANPAEAAAVEASVRDELTAAFAWKRVIAAEAMLDVYRDENAAVAAPAGVKAAVERVVEKLTAARWSAPVRCGCAAEAEAVADVTPEAGEKHHAGDRTTDSPLLGARRADPRAGAVPGAARVRARRRPAGVGW